MNRITLPVETEIDYRLRWETANIPQALYGVELGEWVPYNTRTDVAWNAVHDLVGELPERRKTPENPTRRQRSLVGVGVSLCGPPGTGKTQLAVSALTTAHRIHGASIHFLRAADYVSHAHKLLDLESDRDKREANPELYQSLLNERIRVGRVSLLVVDDLGQEYTGPRGYSQNLLTQLFRRRFHRARPTIITSNHPQTDWHRYELSLPSFAKQAFPEYIVAGIDFRAEARAA
ncbi:ATP-binding protein [Herbidospora galbida]|nr:ATP-binding protein [Herbidospora galbida]